MDVVWKEALKDGLTTMKRIEDLHFRVCDHGLFLPIARRLARDAGHVSYWTPADRAFPTVRECIGDGLPDIERVDCFLCDLESVDCFVFPDLGFSGIQQHLAEMGFPVWGSLGADVLEVSRGKFLEFLEGSGLTVPPYVRVDGISKLREHLRDVEDRWIKVSKFRGDWETFHWRSREEDENELDVFAGRLGPFRELVAFYVFEPIEDAIEDGLDSWCVAGRFPSLVIHGMESKDKAYIGTFQKFADLPEEVRQAAEAIAPVLDQFGYRSFFSAEVRIAGDGESYFIDPTCRAGSPPSQVMTEMIGNYAEVIWEGANGHLIEPEPAAKFGVQVLCHFNRSEDSWVYVKTDDELDRWLKSAQMIGSGDMRCLPPGDYVTGCEDWLVGVGDTVLEAVKHLRHNIELLPDGACCEYDSIAELLKQIHEAEAEGMEFTTQTIPSPASVIES